ncbi:MAG: nuclear transport factor 2 family protein [Vicinamibacteria bacterium]
MRQAWAVLALVGSTLAAAPCAPAADAAKVDPEVLKVREAAWRSWFAGDTAALEKVLPPEFIGISMEGPLTSLPRTLDESRGFRESGGRLVSLAFPETQAQTYGDVVVLYGRYSVTFASGGTEKSVSGRLTEVFVRRDGRWLHPGWHLDTVPAP